MTNLSSDKIKINSRQYWDYRFQTDWELKKGREQSVFFYKLILKHLPQWFLDELKTNVQTVCDAGCAEGDGIAVLSQEFPHIKFTGIDFSESAIEKAKQLYPKHCFMCQDIREVEDSYDVILSSNTLEHLEDADVVLRKLVQKAHYHVVLLLPFQEYERIDEHFLTFDYNSFPVVIASFILSYFKVIDCTKIEGTMWNGKQVLVIYSNSARLPIPSFSLSHLIPVEWKEVLKLQNELEQEKVLLEREKDELHNLINLLEHEKNVLEKEKDELKRERDELKYVLDKIYQSEAWKLAKRFDMILQNNHIQLALKAYRVAKRNGILSVLKHGYQHIQKNLQVYLTQQRHEKELNQILKLHQTKPIIVFPGVVDWNIPLYQRPQHIALNLAKEGFLYFYCTHNYRYDAITGFQRLDDSCYLTNQYHLLTKLEQCKIYHLYSTDMRLLVDSLIDQALERGDLILYEYVDELHPDISGNIPTEVFNRHRRLLKDERVIVVATAEKLYQEVLQYRTKNCALVTNGVDYEHFRRTFKLEEVPEEIKPIVLRGKPIIGYFGALAKWFDYELIVKLAQSRPDYEVLLIGWNYDNSVNNYCLDRFSNIHVIGPIPYSDLPRYAYWFTVSTIPFLINEVTESTSPIKLFEYMALGRPIVTTDMPECRKYRSVIIGKDHDDFIRKVDLALSLQNDETYLKILDVEAQENTWQSKAREIARLLRTEWNARVKS